MQWQLMSMSSDLGHQNELFTLHHVASETAKKIVYVRVFIEVARFGHQHKLVTLRNVVREAVNFFRVRVFIEVANLGHQHELVTLHNVISETAKNLSVFACLSKSPVFIFNTNSSPLHHVTSEAANFGYQHSPDLTHHTVEDQGIISWTVSLDLHSLLAT